MAAGRASLAERVSCALDTHADARSLMPAIATLAARLTPREWTLVVFGLATWVGIIAGGVWFVHQMTRSKASCGTQLEARSTQPRTTPGTGPRNALQLLTGTGKCE